MCTKNDNSETPEEQLKRFIYLSNGCHVFITGDPEIHGHLKKENVGFIEQVIAKSPEKLVNIVEIANGQNAVPHRMNLFFVLAMAAKSTGLQPVQRNAVYTAALSIAKSDEEFFTFIKFLGKVKKQFSSGINKIIAKYYMAKEPKQLVFDISSRKGYFGWTHKDLIKLSHIKTDEILHQIIVTYILRGSEKADAMVNDNDEAKELMEFVKKTHELKISKDEDLVITRLKELKFGLQQIPTLLIKSEKIWEYLLDEMPIRDLMKSLVRLYKYGLLKPECKVHNKVVKILLNSTKITESGVHPIEVFIALKNFEKGGRPKDPKLVKFLEEKEGCELKIKADPEYKKPDFAHNEPVKCPTVVSALNKALKLSYTNVQSTGKRYMLTLDVSEAMDKHCITSKNVTGFEAAIVFILSICKAEKNVTVAVFNGQTVTPVTLDKGSSVVHTMKKLKEADHGEINVGAPLEWAKTKKKPIDIFINFLPKQLSFKKEVISNPVECLPNYKSAMNMSIPKMILFHLCDVCTTIYGSSVLDIRGIDEKVPRIMDAFIKNLF